MRALSRAICALLAAAALVPACAYARHGRGGGVAPNPFALPQLTATQASSMFSFLGSATIPDATSPTGNVYLPSSALYTPDGSHMYLAGAACNPSVVFCDTHSGGIAEITLPASLCSGYTGGSGCTAAVDSTPIAPGITPEVSYTLTSGYSAGDTCAVFSSLPPNISANNGWYLYFGSADNDLVTSVGTCGGANSVGWATALTTAYISTVPVYQWAPVHPWDVTQSQDATVGTFIAHGQLIVSAAMGYDGACNDTLGFAYTASSAALSPTTTWGSINAASLTNASSLWGGAAPESSRALAGPIVENPSIWQPYFGPAYVAMGQSLSIASCFISQGPAFFALNPADITTAGGTLTATTALAYSTGNGMQNQPLTGPFPLHTTTGYYPAALTAAPSQGSTSVTVSLPTSTVTLTANVSANSSQIDVTAITGTLSNSAISYTANDTAGVIPANCCGTFTSFAYDYAPGSTLSTGTYNIGEDSTGAATNDTITLTPGGYWPTAYYKMFFSDGSSAIGTFGTASSGAQVFTPTAPLTGCAASSPCNSSVTIAPMGRAWNTGYDGPFGTAIWVPNTSTWMSFSYHLYGPQNGRGSSDICNSGASESYETPLYPDTSPYVQPLLYLYNASDILNGYNGTQPPYVATPYDVLTFPDAANLLNSNGCASQNVYQNGFANYYAAGNTLYILRGNIILAYKLTPP